MTADNRPSLVVFSSLFPHPGRPTAGVFIRERMFRVGKRLPLTVVSPQPWFPLQSLIRLWKRHFRPPAPRKAVQEGFQIYYPRFFSVPGFWKYLDGLFMALGTYRLVRRLRKEGRCDIIDSHFAYPDGYAATLLGKWLRCPVTITLRGTEVPLSRCKRRRARMLKALDRATRVFAVADSLRRHVVDLGADPDKIRVVGNGVDTAKFHPMDRSAARAMLGVPADARVMITVGALVERKGAHRVLEVMPRLMRKLPNLHYLVVGSAGPEGGIEQQLRNLVQELDLADRVHFLGNIAPERLHEPLSAADVFVLATSNEGWANVFLEAMACGLPVITTDVGGNSEVVRLPELGRVIPFGDSTALSEALENALTNDWDREAITAYARENSWDTRIGVLVKEFMKLQPNANIEHP